MGHHYYTHGKVQLVSQLIFLLCVLPQLPTISTGHTQRASPHIHSTGGDFPSNIGQSEEFSGFRRITARVLRQVDDEQPSLISQPGKYLHHDQQHHERQKRHVDIPHTKHQDGTHLERIKMELALNERGKEHLLLDLQLNKDLMPSGYFESSQRNGKAVVKTPSFQEVDNCHYHGKIRGRPSSWAAVSTCDGVRGVVFDGKDLHYLEPASLFDKSQASGDSPSVKSSNSPSSLQKSNEIEKEDSSPSGSKWDTIHFRHADLTRNFSCAHNHDVVNETNLIGHSLGNLKSNLHPRYKRDAAEGLPEPFNANEKTRYVEMVMVVDNKKFKELGGDLPQTIKRTRDIANIVNALYNPLNIFVALVGIVVWNDADEIVIKTNGDDTLASFLHYRRERLSKTHPNDNAQLLTAVEFENGVVGKAMQGPICSYKYSGGVNSDYKNTPIGVVATTVAHELGHNFGLSHDSEACQCGGYGSRCIMAASSSANNRTSHWSSCSMKDIAYAFDHGMDYCLRNKPKKLYDGPTCGNGFTEPGEQCDCGLPEHCENPCCNAHTCLLHSNATCGAGNCCDLTTCHVKRGGTSCRSARSTCDLPEYCTGESEFCPDDVHKIDGLQCETSTGQAYCYDGECRTHTDQCRLLWGPSGNNSNDLCYQKNSNGSRLAHCGYNLTNSRYSQCSPQDVKCGVLHCQMNSEKLEFGYDSVAIFASFFVNAGGKIHPCRSATVDFGLQDVDPGLVPDGAKCGDDMMCVSQKCTPVQSILGTLIHKCAGDCSGHGVCNSLGHCHCDDGYGGKLCEGGGYGGSIDSGPAIDPYGYSKFGKLLYVTFMGFIPLIAIITFYLYYANDNIKKLCKRGGQAVSRTQNRNNHKPQGNGSVGSGFRSVDISHPTPNAANGQNPAVPDDFFGHYKGFTLAPIKQNGSPAPTSGGHTTTTVNNNISPKLAMNKSPNSPLRGANGHIPSTTNANVYYSPVCQVTNETLVKNSEKPTLKQSFLQKGIARVSWAQPIASPLPTSPGTGSDEESASSDTPLYENTGAEKNSPRIEKMSTTGNPGQRTRPLSSPDAMNEMKLFDVPGGVTKTPGGKSDSRFGSTSALSRLVAAFPFARSSIRSSSSSEDTNKTGTISRQKSFPKLNRDNIEISKPILQNEMDQQKIQGCISVSSQDTSKTKVTDTNNEVAGEKPEYRYTNVPEKATDKADSGKPFRYANIPDEVTGNVDGAKSSFRYANIPDQGTDEVDGAGKSSSRYSNLPSSPKVSIKPALKNLSRVKQTTPPPEHKPAPKVVRAHSMIQPNRNSIGSAPTNNSNYNSLRRSRPTAPPPKPPETPPPVPIPETPVLQSTNTSVVNKIREKSATPPPVPAPNVPSATASAISSILKFSLGRSNSNTSNNVKPSYSPKPTTAMAPIAQSEDSSPPNTTATSPKENIYDVIAETPPSGSSEESSPKVLRKKSLEEKIETLSTGSSESNGGLLSEIIFEIQSRNKESIYNSVDRRKKKREDKAAAAAAAAAAERERSAKTPSSPSLIAKSMQIKSGDKSNPKAAVKGPTLIPTKTPPEKPKVVLNPSVSKTAISRPLHSSPQVSSFTPKPSPSPKTSKTPEVPAHSTVAITSTTPTNTNAKPTCAVNGVPKVTSSPSYVAKINYFSNLSSTTKDKDKLANTPMKPISSLPAPSKENSMKEAIYAPSSGNSPGTPGGAHLSTIRPTWSRPYYNNKQSYFNNVTNCNDNDSNDNTTPKKAGIYSPGSGIYGSLGRKVEAPVIRSNSIEKEKKEAAIIEETPPIEKPPKVNSMSATLPTQPPQVGGYKPFNPYLNRPLTFSTFRPTSGTSGSPSNSKTDLTMTNPKPVTVSTCSVSKPAVVSGVGVTSPVTLRSPTHMVK